MERIKRLFRSRSLAFWLFIVFIVVPGLPFVGVTLASAIYTYWPLSLDEIETPAMAEDVQHIVLLAHGLKDVSATWSDRVARSFESGDPATRVVSLDWNPYSASTLRCSVDGMRIGAALAEEWSSRADLSSVHLIGHSCGSFVVQGFCETLAEVRPEVRIQATFLDPVTVYGGFFWEYGVERFGRCADFAEAYIDTGDTVPGSNIPLPHTHTFDVTSARPGDFGESPHVWPTAYYARLAREGAALDLRASADVVDRYPRGEASGPLVR